MPHDVVRHRLAVQGLVPPRFADPVAAVAWLGAVQSQELADACASVAMRVRGGTAAAVGEALDRGDLLRTHVLRPTWHLVARADLRLLLAATADRVRRLNGTVERRQGVDDVVVGRAQEVFAGLLSGGRSATRSELAQALSVAGVEASGLRLAYLVMRAELDGLLVSGPARGAQQTYALLDERDPGGTAPGPEEARVVLAARFLRGHGPASVTDLARWASLTRAQAADAVDAVASGLESRVVDDVRLWWDGDAVAPATGDVALLLPGYDEAWTAFASVGLALGPLARSAPPDNRWYRPVVVDEGAGCRVVDWWRRDVAAGRTTVELRSPPSAALRRRLAPALERWAAATGADVVLA